MTGWWCSSKDGSPQTLHSKSCSPAVAHGSRLATARKEGHNAHRCRGSDERPIMAPIRISRTYTMGTYRE